MDRGAWRATVHGVIKSQIHSDIVVLTKAEVCREQSCVARGSQQEHTAQEPFTMILS